LERVQHFNDKRSKEQSHAFFPVVTWVPAVRGGLKSVAGPGGASVLVRARLRVRDRHTFADHSAGVLCEKPEPDCRGRKGLVRAGPIWEEALTRAQLVSGKRPQMR